MKIKVLGTGSSGNMVLINDNILIDCGLPYKRIQPYVKQLKLVLLTHGHSDHFKPSTVRTLHRERPALRFGCCEWMVEPLIEAGVSPRNIDVMEFEPDGHPLALIYNDLAIVKPVPLLHDVPNCGWRVIFGDELLFYATDTANLDGIEAPDYDWYLIEANYTEADIEQRIASKLETGQYCYETRARECHMSKEQAISWLAENMGSNSKYMFLHQHREARE